MSQSQDLSQTGPPDSPGAGRLREVALLFLRLGATAFGGPAAHTAIMEDEIVRRRRWMTHETFLDLLGAVNLIPGPNSTELAIHIGYLRAGWPGLLVAGVCFALPAMVLVTAIAWAYVEYGSLPQFAGLLYGIKPVIVSVVLQALWSLGRKAMKSRLLGLLAIVVAAGNYFGVYELAALLVAGLATGVVRGWQLPARQRLLPLAVMFGIAGAAMAIVYLVRPTAEPSAQNADLWSIFVYFLKIGSVLYGSGYVLLAFLQGDLVTRWHWLTPAELLDATAVGQVTPGPLFTTATFIGYLLGRLPGAIVATVGIFLPSFVFVALSGPLIPRLRQSPVMGAFLDGVNAASVALMAVVTWHLSRTAVCDMTTVALLLVSAALLVRFRVNSVWLILGGAIVGLVAQGIG